MFPLSQVLLKSIEQSNKFYLDSLKYNVCFIDLNQSSKFVAAKSFTYLSVKIFKLITHKIFETSSSFHVK